MKKLFVVVFVLMANYVIAQKFENLAQTPPMGWNSWNTFFCNNISEKLIMETADAMVSSGMKDAGYEYIVIDDCWQIGRDENGNILWDEEKFPHGMKALADYIHSKGLKFGLYSDGGTQTCEGRPGSRGYEFQDARTYASWGVDFLKYDWCNHSTQDAKASYTLMRDALYAAGRPVLFSLCEWGKNEPWLWAKDVGHMWRISSDIQRCWDCDTRWGGIGVPQILDAAADLYPHAGPGHWNDPDMMQVGTEFLTINESRSHFSMWCMLAAPLMAGNDIRNMTSEAREILTNKNVIAIDQDPLGRQALRVGIYDGYIQCWSKPLAGGDWAVCFLNTSKEPKKVKLDWRVFKLVDPMDPNNKFKGTFTPNYKVWDVWKQKELCMSNERIEVEILGHDVILLRLKKI